MDTTHTHERPPNRPRIWPRIKVRPVGATVTVEASVGETGSQEARAKAGAEKARAEASRSSTAAAVATRRNPRHAGRTEALRRPDPDEVLRRTLNTAGWLEIALFGLPLIFAGRHVARYVKEHDPHIYKEYGVARIVMGLAFLLGARRPEDRRIFARIGSVFYGCNIIVSLVDLALANVCNVELAVVALSSVFSAALGRLSARPRITTR